VSSGQTVLQSLERTEPDLDLKKEVEQVTTSGFGGTGLALRLDSERRDHGRGMSPRISDLAITSMAVIWLQKQPGKAEGTPAAAAANSFSMPRLRCSSP